MGLPSTTTTKKTNTASKKKEYTINGVPLALKAPYSNNVIPALGNQAYKRNASLVVTEDDIKNIPSSVIKQSRDRINANTEKYKKELAEQKEARKNAWKTAGLQIAQLGNPTVSFKTNDEKLNANNVRNSVSPVATGTIPFLQNAITDKVKEITTRKDRLAQIDVDIDKWIDTSYKMSDDEIRKAKEVVKDYYKNSYNRDNWTEEKQKEFEKIVALENKTSLGSTIMSGIADAMPFADTLGKNADKASGTTQYSDTMQNAQTQNPLAYGGGYLGGTMAEYALGSKLMTSLPVAGQALGKAGESLSKIPVLGKVGADHITNVLGDTTLDVALDTIPQLVSNVKDGKTVGQVASEAAKNVGTNLAYNVGGEALGAGFDYLKKSKQTKKMLEEIANEMPIINKNTNNAVMEEMAKLNPLQYGNVGNATSMIKSADDVTNIPLGRITADVTPNYASMEYSEIPYVKNQDAKNLLDSTVDRIKKDTDYALKTFKDGTDRTELVAQANKALDDFAMNPTDENYLNIIATRNKLNDSMQGTKYKSKRYKTVSVYDNDIARTFNAEADKLYKSATDAYGDIGSIPRLDRSMYQQQGTPFEYAQEIPVLKQTETVAKNQPLNTSTTQTVSKEIPYKKGADNLKNSKYSTTSVPTKTDLPDEVKEIFVTEPTTYRVLSNAETKAKADAVLQTHDDVYSAVSECRRMLDNRDASSIPLGYELSQKLIDSGDVDTAVDLIRDMSRQLTKSGQFTQAAAMTLLHENPQAALRYAVKELDSINTAGAKKFGAKWKDISLTDAEISAFSSINSGDTEAIKELYESIGNRISKEYPATKWEKFVELTKLSMLFNPRTHIRNVVSNAILMPMRSLTDRVSAVGMNVAHIINPDIKVTQSLTGSIGGKYKASATEVWEKVKDGITGNDNKWDDLSGSVFNKQVFKDSAVGTLAKKATVGATEALGKTKIVNHLAGDKLTNLAKQMDKSLTGSFTENLRNLDYYLLSTIEDDAFVKTNFVNRLASYMKAQGITDASQVPDEAISLATTEALKATFKDDNSFTKLLSGAKRNTGKFGEVILPFTKTPANLAMRGLDYSPVGVIPTLKNAKQNGASATFDALSKNLTGTAAIFAGYKLAESGMIQGALSTDKDEKAFQQQQGKQAFSINYNGTSYTFDWAQPASIPIIIGSVLYQSISEDDAENQSQLAKIGNYAMQGGIAAADAWLELSPLQSLADIFDTSYGNTPMQNLVNEVMETPLRLIPALGNAVANANDPNQRVTYSNEDVLGSLKNTAISKIPVLRESLPQSYDTWGNPRVSAKSTGEAFFNNFISPGKSSVNATTPIDSEIERLYNATGNSAVFPRKTDWTLADNKLDNVAYSEAQKNIGQLSYELAENFINSDAYKTMSDADRAETLGNIYSYAKSNYLNSEYSKDFSSTNAKYHEMYDFGGADAVSEYINYKSVMDSVGLSDDDKMRDIWNNDGADGIRFYSDLKEKCTKVSENGNKSIDKTLLYNNLASYDMMTDEEKGYYYYNLAKTDKLTQIVSDMGFEGVYRYAQYKLEADAPGKKTGAKDGSISYKEAINYLNQQDMTADEKRYWYSVMAPSNYQNKNPY